MQTIERQKFMHWMSRCEAIAGSGTYLLSGHPESQVAALRETLRQAATEGIEWQKIYEFIYKTWHPRRPHCASDATLQYPSVPPSNSK